MSDLANITKKAFMRAGKWSPDQQIHFSRILDFNNLVCIQHICEGVKLSTLTLLKRKPDLTEFNMNFTIDLKTDRISPFYKNK